MINIGAKSKWTKLLNISLSHVSKAVCLNTALEKTGFSCHIFHVLEIEQPIANYFHGVPITNIKETLVNQNYFYFNSLLTCYTGLFVISRFQISYFTATSVYKHVYFNSTILFVWNFIYYEYWVRIMLMNFSKMWMKFFMIQENYLY